MIKLIKHTIARLPGRWQQGLKRLHFARQIARGQFDAGEIEFGMLPELVGRGDWVIDVGANVGHYTVRLSDLVGASGRVIAFEPVPRTFEILASNTASLAHANTTLINAAASDEHVLLGMELPTSAITGTANPYQARLTDNGTLRVLTLSIDALRLSSRVQLIKIDAEGHEFSVLKGMVELLARDHPTLIIEGDAPEVQELLSGFGYTHTQLPGSWNRVFRIG